MKKKILAAFLTFVLFTGTGLFISIEKSWAGGKYITQHDRDLANLAARVYPGYFDALSRMTTLFTVPKIDFDDNTRSYEAIQRWGGNPDEFAGEIFFSYSGCDAVLYHKKNTNDYVLSFRGTTAQLQDLLEDLKLLAHPDSSIFLRYKQFEAAVGIVQQVINQYGANNIELTGHSLGGALSQAMALKFGLPAMSINGVGVPDEALEAIGLYPGGGTFWDNAEQIKHYNVKGDPMTDWNWRQDEYSFWDTLPRYGKNYWLPAKYTWSGSRLRNHYYNVLIHQMDRYSTAEYGVNY